MKISTHRIVTSDGIELFGLLYEPDIKSKKVLVHVHGMGGNFYENHFLDYVAKTFTDNNIAFFVFNNRGCEVIKDLYQMKDGKKEIIRVGNAYEKFEDSVFDIKAAIDAVSEWGFSEIHLAGHSLGSPKVVYYLSETKDQRVKSVILLSPSDMLGLVRQNSERFEKDTSDAMDMIKNGKGEEIMVQKVWDEYPVSADTYISLFGDDSKCSVLDFHTPSNTFEALGKITQPLFATMGRKDDSLNMPIETIFACITKGAKNSSRVETNILGDANHGYWGDEQKLADVILKWVKS